MKVPPIQISKDSIGTVERISPRSNEANTQASTNSPIDELVSLGRPEMGGPSVVVLNPGAHSYMVTAMTMLEIRAMQAQVMAPSRTELEFQALQREAAELIRVGNEQREQYYAEQREQFKIVCVISALCILGLVIAAVCLISKDKL